MPKESLVYFLMGKVSFSKNSLCLKIVISILTLASWLSPPSLNSSLHISLIIGAIGCFKDEAIFSFTYKEIVRKIAALLVEEIFQDRTTCLSTGADNSYV